MSNLTLWSRPAWDTDRWLRDFFGPAAPISDPKFVVGKFEGGESLIHGGNAVMTSNSFEFRADVSGNPIFDLDIASFER